MKPGAKTYKIYGISGGKAVLLGKSSTHLYSREYLIKSLKDAGKDPSKFSQIHFVSGKHIYRYKLRSLKRPARKLVKKIVHPVTKPRKKAFSNPAKRTCLKCSDPIPEGYMFCPKCEITILKTIDTESMRKVIKKLPDYGKKNPAREWWGGRIDTPKMMKEQGWLLIDSGRSKESADTLAEGHKGMWTTVIVKRQSEFPMRHLMMYGVYGKGHLAKPVKNPLDSGSKAKYHHFRLVDPSKFQKGSFRTIDPGRPGHVKIVIGRPKGIRSTRKQAILVEKKYYPSRAAAETLVNEILAGYRENPKVSYYVWQDPSNKKWIVLPRKVYSRERYPGYKQGFRTKEEALNFADWANSEKIGYQKNPALLPAMLGGAAAGTMAGVANAYVGSRLRKNPLKRLSVPETHQKKIALQTLRYSDIGARIMGGPTKKEARQFLLSIGYSPAYIAKIEGVR